MQIAVAAGCRVVGIAGGADKCSYVTSLGASATIDYKTEVVAGALAIRCPDGVKNLQMLLFRNARMEGFVVPKFIMRQADFDRSLHELYARGAVTARSHVIEGIHSAADSINLVLQGRNEGKLMVRVVCVSTREEAALE